MLEQIDGVILRTQDYGETHKIVTIFSKKIGRISAIARGAKKPKSKMASVTQPFIEGQFLVYISSGLSTIRQAEIIDSNRKIREDFIKTVYASYIAELTNQILGEKVQEPFIYDQFVHTLKRINATADPRIPVLMYELKLYQKAGYAPILDRCVNCGSKQNIIGFSIGQGGVVCRGCNQASNDTIIFSENVLRLLPLFLQIGLERIGTINVREHNIQLLRRTFDAYYDYYGGYRLKSRKLLNQLDSLQ